MKYHISLYYVYICMREKGTSSLFLVNPMRIRLFLFKVFLHTSIYFSYKWIADVDTEIARYYNTTIGVFMLFIPFCIDVSLP